MFVNALPQDDGPAIFRTQGAIKSFLDWLGLNEFRVILKSSLSVASTSFAKDDAINWKLSKNLS